MILIRERQPIMGWGVGGGVSQVSVMENKRAVHLHYMTLTHYESNFPPEMLAFHIKCKDFKAL